MRKVLKKLETRYLMKLLLISFALDMLYVKSLSVSTVTVFNWLSPVFGLVDLSLASIIFFRIKNKGAVYIPKEYDTLTIEKSFLIVNKIYTYRLQIDNLYNNLENWKIKLYLFCLGSICLISIVSLVCDLLLFLKI